VEGERQLNKGKIQVFVKARQVFTQKKSLEKEQSRETGGRKYRMRKREKKKQITRS